MHHERFSPGEWFDLIPLKRNCSGKYDADPICGPSSICNNLRLREIIKETVDWGEPVPTDFFIMSEGEPVDRSITKLGGLPYRSSASPWPCNESGQPKLFLAQFNFLDSLDLVGDIPGDILLVFADSENEYADNLCFEWQPAGLTGLCDSVDVPFHEDQFSPCFGNIYRGVNFPSAHWRDESDVDTNSEPASSAHLLLQFYGTQIGSAPYYGSEMPVLPGRMLCTLCSAVASSYDQIPWVNRNRPLVPRFGQRSIYSDTLTIGDLGVYYISIDESNELHWASESS